MENLKEKKDKVLNREKKKALEIKRLDKSFEKVDVLKEIDIHIQNGEFISIVGPSGCGKSTLFKVITGLIKEYSGDVRIGNEDARKNMSPIAYMPQKDLLLPWRTLFENATLPLEIAGVDRKKYKEIINPLLSEFGLKGFEDSYPKELSGGMRQRGALLRTFLIDSDLMLLDEPFGALDAITRMEMQEWLLKIWSIHKHSILFITHDIDEALFLSDRVYVMTGRPGNIKLEIEVEASRPRKREMLFEKQYMDYKKEILEILKK